MNATNPLLEQIRSGEAPRHVKKFAAQGMIPVPEDELIPLQVFLTRDADSDISVTARASLKNVSDKTWIRLVERKDPDLDIVGYCLNQTEFSAAVKEKILLNHSIPDELVCQFALKESGLLLDLIIHNQVRLLRNPAILEALEHNSFLSLDQKRRVDEFKTEFVFKKRHTGPAAVEEIARLSFGDILARIPNLDMESQRILKEADENPQSGVSEEQVQETLEKIFTPEELNEIPQEIMSVYQRIIAMKQGEKIRTALLGNKEERNVLIRDSSRQVASMVLKNPRLTEPEVEGYAQMRNLDSSVLRQIGESRAFVKRYTVVHILVRNPKTPSPVALNLLKLLREVDLRNIVRDRNIPELIRRQAKRIYDQKAASRS